jgi:ABC-type nitrate/sulfonate/bicarbonate transport system permease component
MQGAFLMRATSEGIVDLHAPNDPAVHSYAAPGVPRLKVRPKPTMFETLRLWLGPVGLLVLNLGTFFSIWEYIAYQEYLPKIFFPRPTQVAVEFWEMILNGQMLYHASFSLLNLTLGFALAAGVGIPIGLAAGTFPKFNRLISPYYWSLNSMPRLAIWPLLVLWGGFSIKVKIVLIFISAIMPILINTIAGVSTVDPTLIRVGRVLNASRLQLYTKIVIPFTLPFLLTGLTQGMSRGLVALVVSEMLGSGRGLGYVIVRSVEEFNPSKVFAVLFVLIFIAMVMVNGMGWLEHRAAPWRKRLQI